MLQRSLSAAVVVCALLAASACSKDPEVAKREYMRTGDEFAAQNKFAEAVIEYGNAVRVDARFGEARLKLADAYMKVGNIQRAFAQYVRASDLLPNNVDAHLKTGQLLLARGSFEDARARANKALAVDPKNIPAQILKGNALAGLRDMEGAIAQLEEAIREDPSRGISYSSLGAVHQAGGDLKLAEQSFLRAVAADPKAVQSHLALANFYWSTDRIQDAEQAFKAALAVDPKNALANRALTSFYLGTGRSKEAEAPLKVLAEILPDSSGRLALADYYISANRPAEAQAILKSLASEPAMFLRTRLRFASIADAAGDRAGAYGFLREALKSDPKDQRALAALARLQLTDGKLDEALATARTVLAVNADSANNQFLMGQILARRNAPEEALAAYQKALGLSPSHLTSAVESARLSLALGKTDQAIQYAQTALQIDPTNAEARLLRGRASLTKGDLFTAEQDLTLLKRSTFVDIPDVQAELGRLYLSKGDGMQARAAFERALAANKTQLNALEGLIMMDLGDKKPAAARARADAVVAANPSDDVLQLLAGRTYLILNDNAAAERVIKKALTLNPDNLKAYGALGQVYLNQGRLPDATKEAENLLKRQPKSVEGRTTLGMLLEMQNRSADARPHYEKALELNPRAAVAANNLAFLHAQRGEQLDLALELAQTAKSVLPDRAEINDTLGFVYYKKGLMPLAIASFKESVEKDPNIPTFHLHLGLAYAGAKDKENARRSLQRALALKLSPAEAAEANKALAALPS